MDCTDPPSSFNVCTWQRVTHFAYIKPFTFDFTDLYNTQFEQGRISFMAISTSCPCTARISLGVLVIQILRTESYSRNHRCVVVRAPWVHSPSLRPTNQRVTIRQIAITLLLLRLAHERIHQKSQKRKDSILLSCTAG